MTAPAVRPATPLPWHTDFEALGVCVIGTPNRQIGEVYEDGQEQTVEDEANAAYIVAACNALPALEAENAQLRADRAALIAELKRLCIEIPRQLGSNVPMKNALLAKIAANV
jgi:hypothetical protein